MRDERFHHAYTGPWRPHATHRYIIRHRCPLRKLRSHVIILARQPLKISTYITLCLPRRVVSSERCGAV